MNSLQDSYSPQVSGDNILSAVIIIFLIIFLFVGLWWIYQSVVLRSLVYFSFGIFFAGLAFIGIVYPTRRELIADLLLNVLILFVLLYLLDAVLIYLSKVRN